MKPITLEQVERATALCFAADLPPAIWGKPGIGKSSVIQQLAKRLGYKLYDFRLSDKEPADLGGIPVPDGDKVRYLAPANLPIGTDEKAIVFFDEADRAELAVLNVAIQWWLDRQCNGHRLSPNARVVLAGNGTTDVGTTPLTEAAQNRVIHLYVESGTTAALDAWLDWAAGNGVSEELQGFAKYRREVWTGPAKATDTALTDMAFPTPRSFVYADRLCQLADKMEFRTDDILLPVVAGCVGEGAAVEFLAYRRQVAESPTIDQIVADPDGVRVPEAPDIMYALGLQLADFAKSDVAAASAFATYALRWPEEPASNFFRRLLAKQPKIALDPSYQAWEARHLKAPRGTGSVSVDVVNLTPQIAQAFADGTIVLLPSNDQWGIRLNVPSKSNPQKPHVVAQRRNDSVWACDCSGWVRHRTCSHLTDLGLR